MKRILESRQMEGMDALTQAKKAIAHVLNQRHSSPQLAYWIAPGSQSFALLTEAAATLFGEDLKTCREKFASADTIDAGKWKLALEDIAYGHWRRDGVVSAEDYAGKVLNSEAPWLI